MKLKALRANKTPLTQTTISKGKMTLLSKKKAENDTSVFSNNQNDTSDPPNVTSVCKMTLLSLILVQIEKLI